MLEKNEKKIISNLEKPINTGVLRFLLFDAIATATKPITILEIRKNIEAHGYTISQGTIYNSIAEMIRGNEYSTLQLQSIIQHSGSKSRARAFYFTNTPKIKK